MKHDKITTTLKMLKARGGALDLKAVEIIEAMNEVGEELTAERTDFRGAMQELDEVRAVLAKALNIQPADDDTPLLLAHHVANALSVAHQRLAVATAGKTSYRIRARETKDEQLNEGSGMIDAFEAFGSEMRAIDPNFVGSLNIRQGGDYGFRYIMSDGREGLVLWSALDIAKSYHTWEGMGKMAAKRAIEQMGPAPSVKINDGSVMKEMLADASKLPWPSLDEDKHGKAGK